MYSERELIAKEGHRRKEASYDNKKEVDQKPDEGEVIEEFIVRIEERDD